MSYEYDVFLSYRRSQSWPKWVNDFFKEYFIHWLSAEYGDDCSVFIDVDCIENGMDWPKKLADAHAKSKVLVPLLSKQYFSSDWCLAEIRLMKAREYLCKIHGNNIGLIVPASIHDGVDFPEEIHRIQYKDLTKFPRITMRSKSELAEELESEIISWVPNIVEAINNAPDFDPDWTSLNEKEFEKVFEKHRPIRQKLIKV